MESKGVYVINSAVFHSGFLVGSDYYDYRLVEKGDPKNDALFKWREEFFEVCRKFNVKPAQACVQFALNVPGVKSIALNTTDVKRVKENLEMANTEIPVEFWEALQSKGLIQLNFSNNFQPVLENIKRNQQ
jgi:D-threo-aldose 1-dehydrogenase